MVSLTLRPLSDVDSLQLCQRPQQFDWPAGCRCPSPRPGPGCWSCPAPLSCHAFADIPGPAAGCPRIPPAPCRAGSTGAGALGEGPVFNLDSFHRMSKSALALASASPPCRGTGAAAPSPAGWAAHCPGRCQGSRTQRTRRLGTAAPQRGQHAVEGVPPHVVQVQPVRFPKAPLVRSLSQHPQPSLHLLIPSIAAGTASATFRPGF